jgi:hypothetical protein
MRLFAFIVDFPDTEVLSRFLKVAGSAFCTDQAIKRMIGQNEFHHCFPGIQYPDSIGSDNHSVLALGSTGGGQILPAVNLNHTYPASAGLIFYVQVLKVQVAQRWYFYTCRFSSFQQAGTCFYLNRPVING